MDLEYAVNIVLDSIRESFAPCVPVPLWFGGPHWDSVLPYFVFFAVIYILAAAINTFVFGIKRNSIPLLSTCCNSLYVCLAWPRLPAYTSDAALSMVAIDATVFMVSAVFWQGTPSSRSGKTGSLTMQTRACRIWWCSFPLHTCHLIRSMPYCLTEMLFS